MTQKQDKKKFTLYRVQGSRLGNPVIKLSPDSDKIDEYKHLFVSKTKEHHEYYINKRVFQYIKRFLFEREKDFIEWKKTGNCEQFNLTSPQFLTFVDLEIPWALYELLEENALSASQKVQHERKYWMPRIVDEKRLGGGYHLTKRWLKLLNDSLLMVRYQHIGAEEIINNLFDIDSYPIKSCDFTDLKRDGLMIEIPSDLKAHREDIYWDLKWIVKNKAFQKESSLALKPKETIDKIMAAFDSCDGKH